MINGETGQAIFVGGDEGDVRWEHVKLSCGR